MRRHHTRRRLGACLGMAVALAVLGAGAWAATPPARPSQPPVVRRPPAPRLLVLLVMDMFRPDYLTRVADRIGPDGFRRLMREGARFDSCAYRHAITVTAPGHASIVTGTTPDRHGIIANQWYDRRLEKMVGAVEDADAPLVGAAKPQPGASPHHLAGDTLGDEIRLATGGRGHVFGVSVKPRSAVLLAGRAGNGAFFYDEATGRMVSSTYYGETLPAWASAWNARQPADRYAGRLAPLPGGGDKTRREESRPPDPAYYKALPETPWITELLLDFARTIVVSDRLGTDDDLDVLGIGLSGHDYAGHAAGPYSRAIADMTADADTRLAAFLRFLDERVGRDRYWVVLTADHGTAPTLADSEKAGLRPEGLDRDRLREVIRRDLNARFGSDAPLLFGESTSIWFDHAALTRAGIEPEEAARVAGRAALEVPGIAGWVAAGRTNLDPVTLEAYRLSSFGDRTPDLFLARAPFALERTSDRSDHGTPWWYDSHVPLILAGAPFRPGVYRQSVSPIDVAPTLATALGIPAPALATGRVLAEALR
jgi:type I phosphodiesterase/nucleotide pyrophosphatase